MKPSELSLQGYHEDILTAHEQGLIHFANPDYLPFGPDRDEFSHLPGKGIIDFGGLRRTNTRPLLSPALQVLGKFMDAHFVRFLEMGQGAGKASYEAFRLFLLSRVKARIETIGLTPVNPYLGLTKTSEEIVKILASIIDSLRGVDGLAEYVGSLDWLVPLDAVLELQRNFGIHVFDVLDKPFIDKQHIGFFPQEVVLEDQYDFIYDNRGVIRYAEECLHDVMHFVGSHLSETGIFCSAPSQFVDDFSDLSGDLHCPPEDFVLLPSVKDKGSNDVAFWVRAKNPLGQILSARGYPVSITVEDYQTFFGNL